MNHYTDYDVPRSWEYDEDIAQARYEDALWEEEATARRIADRAADEAAQDRLDGVWLMEMLHLAAWQAGHRWGGDVVVIRTYVDRAGGAIVRIHYTAHRSWDCEDSDLVGYISWNRNGTENSGWILDNADEPF